MKRWIVTMKLRQQGRAQGCARSTNRVPQSRGTKLENSASRRSLPGVVKSREELLLSVEKFKAGLTRVRLQEAAA
jgi:hypothetical protein